MQNTIKIQEVDIEFVKKGKNGYHKATVTYTDEAKDKNFSKTLMSFKNPKVFGVIQEASPGDRFEVEVKKEGDFYEWVTINEPSAKAAPSRAPASSAATAPRGGSWETPEERARKQVYIVKQSSLTAALALLELRGDTEATKDDVIGLARDFVEFVFESEDKEDLGTLDTED